MNTPEYLIPLVTRYTIGRAVMFGANLNHKTRGYSESSAKRIADTYYPSMYWRYVHGSRYYYLQLKWDGSVAGDWESSLYHDENSLFIGEWTEIYNWDFTPIDTLIQALLPGIRGVNSHRYCECCLNLCNVDCLAGRWWCKSCQQMYTLAPENPQHMVSTTKTDPKELERQKMTTALRFTILKRDGFKCRACGRNPREHDVVLHVDHIVAIDNGGKTEMDNLHTLCKDCNLAKSNKQVRQMELWGFET